MSQNIAIKDALIVTGATNNVTMLLRDVLRRNGFTIASQKTSISEVREAINHGEGQLIVIDDTPEVPAAYALRSLFTDPICCLTPTIVLMSETISGDDLTVASIGNPAILKKPLTPAQFEPMLSKLNERWASEDYQAILSARQHLLQENTETALRSLISLSANEDVQLIAAPAVAWYYRKSKNLRTAEKLLLSVLKNNSRNIGIVLALSDLYLHAAMPATAKKLLMRARLMAGGESIAIDLDLVQADLLLGNLAETLPTLESLVAEEKMSSELSPLLMKIVYSEGLYDQSKKYSGKKLLDLKTIEAAWNPAPTSASPGKAS